MFCTNFKLHKIFFHEAVLIYIQFRCKFFITDQFTQGHVKKKKKVIKKFSSTNEIFFFLNFIKKSRIKKNPKNKQTAKKD